jgi:HlyD family secretion protein
MQKWRARIIGALGILFLLGVIVAAMKPKPAPVEVVLAKVGLLEQQVVDDGRARIRERYTVSAPVSGTLARIEVHEGDSVEPGAVLARLLPLPSPLLDPRARDVAQQRIASAQDAHHQAEVTLERAKATAEVARRDFDRTRALAAGDAATQAQVDTGAAELKLRIIEANSAQFAERVAAHAINEARAALETFSPRAKGGEQLEITSPVHGKVLHVLRKDEGVVTAGTALIEVGDPEALEIVVDVLSQDASLIRPGMSAHILHWGGDKLPLQARVRRTEPAAFTRTSALGVDEQRVNVLLDLETPPEVWRTLGDGFAVEVAITVWQKPDALQVPTSALFRDNQGWAVFVAQKGKATTRHVEVGHRGPLQSEILSGMKAGEETIIHPGATVKNGVAVEVRP